MRRSEWHEARAGLTSARDLFAEVERRTEGRAIYELVPMLGDLGVTVLALGDRGRAIELGASALDTLARARRPPGHAALEGCSSIAEVFVGLAAEAPGAEPLKQAERAVALLEQYRRVFPIGGPRHALWRGRLLWLRGKHGAARAVWAAGLDAATNLAMAHDVRQLADAIAGVESPAPRLTSP